MKKLSRKLNPDDVIVESVVLRTPKVFGFDRTAKFSRTCDTLKEGLACAQPSLLAASLVLSIFSALGGVCLSVKTRLCVILWQILVYFSDAIHLPGPTEYTIVPLGTLATLPHFALAHDASGSQVPTKHVVRVLLLALQFASEGIASTRPP